MKKTMWTLAAVFCVIIATGCAPSGDKLPAEAIGDGIGSQPDQAPEVKQPKYDVIPLEPLLETDIAFKPYIDKYTENARYYGIEPQLHNVPVVFGDTVHISSRTLAYCVFLRNGQNAVVINKTKWDVSSELKKTLIITHELGHCERGYNHVYEYVPSEDLRPKSLMWGWAVPEYIFQQYFHEFMEHFYTKPEEHPPLRISRQLHPLADKVECALEE